MNFRRPSHARTASNTRTDTESVLSQQSISADYRVAVREQVEIIDLGFGEPFSSMSRGQTTTVAESQSFGHIRSDSLESLSTSDIAPGIPVNSQSYGYTHYSSTESRGTGNAMRGGMLVQEQTFEHSYTDHAASTNANSAMHSSALLHSQTSNTSSTTRGGVRVEEQVIEYSYIDRIESSHTSTQMHSDALVESQTSGAARSDAIESTGTSGATRGGIVIEEQVIEHTNANRIESASISSAMHDSAMVELQLNDDVHAGNAESASIGSAARGDMLMAESQAFKNVRANSTDSLSTGSAMHGGVLLAGSQAWRSANSSTTTFGPSGAAHEQILTDSQAVEPVHASSTESPGLGDATHGGVLLAGSQAWKSAHSSTASLGPSGAAHEQILTDSQAVEPVHASSTESPGLGDATHGGVLLAGSQAWKSAHSSTASLGPSGAAHEQILTDSQAVEPVHASSTESPGLGDATHSGVLLAGSQAFESVPSSGTESPSTGGAVPASAPAGSRALGNLHPGSPGSPSASSRAQRPRSSTMPVTPSRRRKLRMVARSPSTPSNLQYARACTDLYSRPRRNSTMPRIFRWPTLLALALMALLLYAYAWLYIGSLWNPNAYMAGMPVAILNDDVGPDAEGKAMGAAVVSLLKGNPEGAFNWKVLDGQQGATRDTLYQLVESGQYAAALYIPSGFSRMYRPTLSDRPGGAVLPGAPTGNVPQDGQTGGAPQGAQTGNVPQDAQTGNVPQGAQTGNAPQGALTSGAPGAGQIRSQGQNYMPSGASKYSAGTGDQKYRFASLNQKVDNAPTIDYIHDQGRDYAADALVTQSMHQTMAQVDAELPQDADAPSIRMMDHAVHPVHRIGQHYASYIQVAIVFVACIITITILQRFSLANEQQHRMDVESANAGTWHVASDLWRDHPQNRRQLHRRETWIYGEPANHSRPPLVSRAALRKHLVALAALAVVCLLVWSVPLCLNGYQSAGGHPMLALLWLIFSAVAFASALNLLCLLVGVSLFPLVATLILVLLLTASSAFIADQLGPAFFQIGRAFPFYYAVRGLRFLYFGAVGRLMWVNVLALLAWICLPLAISLFITARRNAERRRTDQSSRMLKQGRLRCCPGFLLLLSYL
ncbi:hypothetical protein THASP1DRAFT_28185 [Thamnocephalis sphaerospora]|uniref:DUF3533 domain-containing protein n=1 Tax=Thamnocephalis sphaerospora TaxID=78915 RepID=A0A4P9XUW4_9FUNG|nr:hypothetical protein THASP1DRAFT_28185 [Thamnocephalis sphaerospora]|eukprot:RKP10035.1 hypothetical protein THASP1DRAFT_28185 [Thamnocephalis sphaerospora]